MSLTTNTTENYSGHGGLTQRAALLMAANILATAMSFALPLVLVRTMSQAEYGLYKQAFQIMTSALCLLNLQVAVSIFYFYERAPGKGLQVSLNVMLFYGMIGALVFLIFLIWPSWVTLIFQGADLVPHVPLLGFAIFCWLVSSNLDAVPIAAGDVRMASALIVLSQFTKAVVMIIAGLVFGSLDAILVAAVIQGLIQITFMVIYIRRRFGRFLTAIDWKLFKSQIGNALPFGVGGIAAIVQNDMHGYFVSHYFDPARFAIYSVGCFQLPVLSLLAASFANALNPELAKYKEANDYWAIINIWMDVIRKLTFVFAPAFALLLALRREFITLLFTENYAASVPIFAINMLSMLLGVAVHLHILRLFDRLKFFRLKLYLALIPVTFGSLYVGLRLGGLIGVAVAVVCIQTLDALVTLAMIKRELGMSRRDLRRLAPLLRIAAAAAVAAIGALATRYSLGHAHTAVTFLACAAVFCLVYPIAALAMGAVSQEEKASLGNLWEGIFRRPARFKATSATEG
ncbi:MAG TPA: lipopolysaccharide biosynthesis protein [Blastocatellia bacterium]|nr:lipopolysaccharide biosynthesis protein [Blastocatellia bacterium]